jgi:hypothetical protein
VGLSVHRFDEVTTERLLCGQEPRILHCVWVHLTVRMPSCTMKAIVAKIVMRIAGTLAGLMGFCLFSAMLVGLYSSITERDLRMVPFAVFSLAISAYLMYAAYLVWFRFSPLAVRHVCGALGFCVLMLLMQLPDWSRIPDQPWMEFAFLGSFVAVYIAYRLASNRLSRLLFPESSSEIQEESEDRLPTLFG